MWQLDLNGTVQPFDLARFRPANEPSRYVLFDADGDPDWLPDEAFAWIEAIAIRFPVFTDGRPFSLATILRARGWQGPLVAVGNFLLDQLDCLRRVGFTGFAPNPERFPREALATTGARLLHLFSDPYQASAAVPQPLWQRRQRGKAEAGVGRGEAR